MNKLENIKKERQERLNLEDEIRSKIYKNVLAIDRIIEKEIPKLLMQYIEEDANYKQLVNSGKVSFGLRSFKIEEVNKLLDENNMLSDENKVYKYERSKYISSTYPCTKIQAFELKYETFEKLVSATLSKYELKTIKSFDSAAEIIF